ncbi:hypothetical protein FGE12_12335 [Aggregicoccus sp. 17bor-14]|uniref:hypothetical protein n=1 Tax=Myxococcaceae TaxID=31 RepID=UPI00129C5842|nr:MULTISPECIES: hypothetical protein [Myxococcaceae]MBF5043179.1 hypothetical protein [Simulacricoccus sp. 17bor-14]MRI88937.1 hypothetical protein [Aggregicoccus sp. 17bor-14]
MNQASANDVGVLVPRSELEAARLVEEGLATLTVSVAPGARFYSGMQRGFYGLLEVEGQGFTISELVELGGGTLRLRLEPHEDGGSAIFQ